MYQRKSILAVIPAYNEETQLGKVLDTLPELVDRVVVVDDASTDGTAAVAEERRRRDERIVLLRHEANQGVGGAIATGYRFAAEHGFDVAVVLAGDGQMDPDDLPAILDPVVAGRADYSKANRLFTGEAYRTIPKLRYFGNSVLSLLTKIASGYWHVADSQAGYTAINRAALQTIDWDRMYKRYGQPNDLLVRLNVCGFRVADVHVRPVYNVGETSGIRIPRAVFSVGFLLLRLFLWRLKEKYVIRDFHPLVFFYLLSFLLFGLAAFFQVHLVYLWSLRGSAPELTALGLLFSLAMALQSLFFAFWFDMESNRHLK